jgi:hypothetical protein
LTDSEARQRLPRDYSWSQFRALPLIGQPYTRRITIRIRGTEMKLKIATVALLAATAGSASANGGDVLAGAVVGAIIGSQFGSHGQSSVSVHYGGYAPPVLVAPAPVVGYAPPPPIYGYAPPPPVYGYARPYMPPVVVYPSPPVHYGPPPGHWKHHHHRRHHHRDDDHGRWGHRW